MTTQEEILTLLEHNTSRRPDNVTPIRPTVGMSQVDQLRAFVAWEQSTAPDKTHIAEWALVEIEKLEAKLAKYEQQEPVARIHSFVGQDHAVISFLDGGWSLTDLDSELYLRDTNKIGD